LDVEPIKEYNGNFFNEGFRKPLRSSTPINDQNNLKKFEPVLRDKKKQNLAANYKENIISQQ
jgi:hypothetical protein